MTPLFYCHGLPGSSAEISAFIVDRPDLINVLGPLDFAAFETAISRSKNPKAHLIAFSLGAMTALKIAAHYPDAVERVTLIAPAAPLELGNFLPHMAGEPVFNMAAKGRTAFGLFTAVQRMGVAFAADRVVKTMFAGSPKSDQNLLSNPDFKTTLIEGLKTSLGPTRTAYSNAVLTYVQPWAHDLKNIECPVSIHHGTADNWAPINMSKALAQAIPSDVTLMDYEGLGHYSTLQAAFPRILNA